MTEYAVSEVRGDDDVVRWGVWNVEGRFCVAAFNDEEDAWEHLRCLEGAANA